MTGYQKGVKRLWFNLKYLGHPKWDTGVSPSELLDYLHGTTPGRALDLGCGTGTNLLTLARSGWEVTGVDLAMLSIWQARRKLRKAGCNGRLIHGDAGKDLGFTQDYKLVLDIGCYHSLTESERDHYRRLLVKRMEQGGTFLLYAHWRKSSESLHGVDGKDLEEFNGILRQVWRKDGAERRPDGGGGFGSVWVRYDCL